MNWQEFKDSLIEPGNDRLARWQGLTLALLVTGYAGYYLCRSNLSVALPFIVKDMVGEGYDPDYAKLALGRVASVGVFAYAIGKFVSGGLTDRIGGRRSFLAGMAGSIVATAIFALSGSVPMFSFAWVVNRLFQTTGWVGIVRLTSRWFSYSTYGTAMGVLSLSYLFGDAAARTFMGFLFDVGLDWRGVFFIGATILLLLLGLSFWLLKESPTDIGEREPHSHPGNLFADRADETAPQPLIATLRPFLRSRAFLAVCALSLGFTLIRETFNIWTPLYFTEVAHLNGAAAAQSSALFPLLGGISVVLAGFLGDRLGANGRAQVIFGGLMLTAVALLVLGWVDLSASPALPVAMVALTGFVMIGPYSYLGGAMALDIGGKQASATAAGIIDGVGYLGAVLSGDVFARLCVVLGWDGAFGVLAAVAVLSSVPAVVLMLEQSPATRRSWRAFR